MSNASLRVGIDLTAFEPGYSGGVSTFALGLSMGLLHTLNKQSCAVILSSPGNSSFLCNYFKNYSVRIVCVRTSLFGRIVHRLIIYISFIFKIYQLRFWYESLFRSRPNRRIDSLVDILLVPTTCLNFFSLTCPTILCIHDIQQEYYPHFFTPHQKILRWAHYRLSCSRASLIQVSSNFVADCLLEKFLFLDRDKIFVAPEGVDLNLFSPSKEYKRPLAILPLVDKEFLFYPAQIWKHKNHALLFEALSKFRNVMGFEFPCILTGADCVGYWSELDDLRRSYQLSKVLYLGRVEFNDILWLYTNCNAVLSLGLHESSSLPVREGAAFGRPLICSNIVPNIESSSTLNLTLFNHDSSGDLAQVLIDHYNDPNELLRFASHNLSKVTFLSWDNIASIYHVNFNRLL